MCPFLAGRELLLAGELFGELCSLLEESFGDARPSAPLALPVTKRLLQVLSRAGSFVAKANYCLLLDST